MKQAALAVLLATSFFACSPKEKTAGTTENKNTRDNTYEATFPGDFTQDVSDADVHAVMMSYKEWENGDMAKAEAYYADTVMWDNAQGEKQLYARPDLMKKWGTYRDSLSSVVIKMDAWDRAYDTVKKQSYVLTWYKEYDTYKSGKVDSADFQDVNGISNGKISYLSQYRKPLK